MDGSASQQRIWAAHRKRRLKSIGQDGTFLSSLDGISTRPAIDPAAGRSVPLAVLDVDPVESASLYPQKLVLSPDQHVA